MLTLKQFGDSTWFDTEFEDWLIEYKLRVDAAGNLSIAALKITPLAWFSRPDTPRDQALARLRKPIPTGGISARLLRRIPIGAETRYGRTVIRTQNPLPDPVRPSKNSTRRVGRPDMLGMSFYRKVAKRWHQLAAARHPTPNKVLEQEFGYGQSAMASVIRRCRAKHLIPPSGRTR